MGDNLNILTQANANPIGSGSSHVVGDLPTTGWSYWQNYYYPYIIRESYPVYIQERAMDKGQKAFEIIKMLQDKKLIKLDKVADFIEAMDALIKTL